MFVWEEATAVELIREAARLGAPSTLIVRTACACARVALPLTRKENRAACVSAIESAENCATHRSRKGLSAIVQKARAVWMSAEPAERAAHATARAAHATRAAAREAAAWSEDAASWAMDAADATEVNATARSVLTSGVILRLSRGKKEKSK